MQTFFLVVSREVHLLERIDNTSDSSRLMHNWTKGQSCARDDDDDDDDVVSRASLFFFFFVSFFSLEEMLDKCCKVLRLNPVVTHPKYGDSF